LVAILQPWWKKFINGESKKVERASVLNDILSC
jgi:hypothetical protein